MTLRTFDSPGGMRGRVPALKGSQAALCDDAGFFTQGPQAESGEVDESGEVVNQAHARIESGRTQVNHNIGQRGTWTGTDSRQRPRQFARGLNQAGRSDGFLIRLNRGASAVTEQDNPPRFPCLDRRRPAVKAGDSSFARDRRPAHLEFQALVAPSLVLRNSLSE